MVVLMAVVVQPRAKHVEVGLQRFEQFIHHIASRHGLVAERVVRMMGWTAPLGGVIPRRSGWGPGDCKPLLMLAR